MLPLHQGHKLSRYVSYKETIDSFGSLFNLKEFDALKRPLRPHSFEWETQAPPAGFEPATLELTALCSAS